MENLVVFDGQHLGPAIDKRPGMSVLDCFLTRHEGHVSVTTLVISSDSYC